MAQMAANLQAVGFTAHQAAAAAHQLFNQIQSQGSPYLPAPSPPAPNANQPLLQGATLHQQFHSTVPSPLASLTKAIGTEQQYRREAKKAWQNVGFFLLWQVIVSAGFISSGVSSWVASAISMAMLTYVVIGVVAFGGDRAYWLRRYENLPRGMMDVVFPILCGVLWPMALAVQQNRGWPPFSQWGIKYR